MLGFESVWFGFNDKLFFRRFSNVSGACQFWLVFGDSPFKQLLELVWFEEVGLPNEIVQDMTNAFQGHGLANKAMNL